MCFTFQPITVYLPNLSLQEQHYIVMVNKVTCFYFSIRYYTFITLITLIITMFLPLYVIYRYIFYRGRNQVKL